MSTYEEARKFLATQPKNDRLAALASLVRQYRTEPCPTCGGTGKWEMPVKAAITDEQALALMKEFL